jgi:hypothetical protein
LFWVKSDGEIDSLKSLDNGETWDVLEYLGYSPTGAVSGLAAAYKPNGDLALFFTDGSTLFIIERVAGEWLERIAWDKSTGDLTGVAAVYEGDFKLLLCGKDAAGNFKVWSSVYGDGADVSIGVWYALKELASAPADNLYEFGSVFLDNPDPLVEGECVVCRCFYVEIFTGTESYSRPFGSHTLPGTSFLENRWREPVPFETESPFGLAMAHDSQYAWLSSPSGVWRASLALETLDLSADVISVVQASLPVSGSLTVELRNDRGQYSEVIPLTRRERLGEGEFSVGCQISLAPGYRTPSGAEVSPGQTFILQALEYSSLVGKASFFLYAKDGWSSLADWAARSQFRWNKPDEFGAATSEASVKEILAQILARSGLRLEIISASSIAGGFFPDFTIHPGDGGHAVIARLLSFIPDLIFLEGNTAFLLNPLAGDAPVYQYFSPFGEGGLRGISNHQILEAKYRTSSWKINRVTVEGAGVLSEAFAWPEIQNSGDILDSIADSNITNSDMARDRAQTVLRKAEMESFSGLIRVPVNCGQQLYDVISVTDPRAGLSDSKHRVLGITLSYLPSKSEYQQKLILGAP